MTRHDLRMLGYACLVAPSMACAPGASAQAPRSQGPAAAPRDAMDPVERNRILPIAAYHQHLMGPTFLATWHQAPMNAATLPPVLDSVLRGHRALIGAAMTADSGRSVYAPAARLLLAEQVVQGAPAIAKYWSGYKRDGFVRFVVPNTFALREDHGHITGIMVETRPDSSTRYARRLAHVLLNIEKGSDGSWRIVTASSTPMSRAVNTDTITAASLVAQMDEAGVRYGVVPAMGYDLSEGRETPGERERVRAENDWAVQQVAQFPGRLVVFCGLNATRDYVVAEMDRCAKMPGMRGIKVYIRNSANLEDKADLEKVRAFFRAANERRLPLMVHNSIDMRRGTVFSRIFLEQLVSAAPDIPIQIAHMGGGDAFALGARDEALKVYADAAAAGNPLMKNLYFDMTGSIDPASPAAVFDTLAQRMRTIGLKRILFGTDLPFHPFGTVREEWAKFRSAMPLTNDELRIIADNVAPYAR